MGGDMGVTSGVKYNCNSITTYGAMDNKNRQQWTTMDNDGQQSAVLHASVMPFFLKSPPCQ